MYLEVSCINLYSDSFKLSYLSLHRNYRTIYIVLFIYTFPVVSLEKCKTSLKKLQLPCNSPQSTRTSN